MSDINIYSDYDVIRVRVNETSAISNDHTQLDNRDTPDQHPISAVTGLREALNEIEGAIPTELSELEQDENHRTVTDEEKAAWDAPVSWDEVEDKPTVFPPSAHTHAMTSVEGLPEALTELEESIPTQLSQLAGDAEHRTVTEAQKVEWSDKAEKPIVCDTLPEASAENHMRVAVVNGQRERIFVNLKDGGEYAWRELISGIRVDGEDAVFV